MEKKVRIIKHAINKTISDAITNVELAGKFYCDATYKAKRKKYDSILLIYTTKGLGYLKYRKKHYALEPDTIMLINCNYPHAYYADDKKLWDFTWVHFKGGQSMSQTDFILSQHSPVFISSPKEIVYTNLLNIFEIIDKEGMDIDLALSLYMNEILHYLMAKSLPIKDTYNEVPETIKKARNYFELNYMNKITIDDVAKSLYINKYDLIRKFKKHTQVSPYRYLINYRLEKAKVMLKMTDLSITEICYEVGFDNPSYFIKMFKSLENMTPLNYRKQY